MRKSKLMKALLVFGMSVVTATSLIGFTACGNDEHNHIDEDNDGKCDICETVMTPENPGGDNNNPGGDENNPGGDENNPGGDDENNPPAPSTKETVVWNVDDNFTATTVTDEVELKAGMGVYAGKDLIFEVQKGKKLTYKGAEIGETKNRVKFNGDGDTTKKYLHVNVEQAATVIVYAWCGTGGAPAYLKMLNSAGQAVGTAQQVSDGTNSVAWAAMFAVEANTDYYIVSDSTAGSGAKHAIFNYVAVDYDFKETFTPVEAKEPECEVDGHYAHSVSDYGRYKNEAGELISRNSVVRAKLNHNYSLKQDSITAPTATETGTATLTCANGHETPVELPVLTSDRYTARPEVDVEGTYTITVEGVQISFTATGVGKKETTYTDVYKLENFTGVTVGSAKTEGENCVYATSGTAAVDTDGSLKCTDSSAATTAYISLGAPITSGVVRITGSIKVASTNGSWTFFQILNSDASPAEFAGFRTGSGGAWGYRLEGTGNPATLPITAATSVYHSFEILIDFDSKTLNIKVDGNVIADSVALGTKATGLSSIHINCNAGRTINLASVTIATQD